MPVHSLHIFDRKGKTLFTKKFVKDTPSNTAAGSDSPVLPTPLHGQQQQQQQQSAAATATAATAAATTTAVSQSQGTSTTATTTAAELDQLSEQRKLVFGMIFSLREVVSCLSPSTPSSSTGTTTTAADDNNNDGGLHSVQTGASTLYSYETPSGLRLAMYMTPSRKGEQGTMSSGGGGGGSQQQQGQGQGQGQGQYQQQGQQGQQGLQQSYNNQQLQQQQQQQQGGLVLIKQQQQRAKSIRLALKHIYHELWIQCVTRSPLYTPTNPNVEDTNFGQRLETFLKAQTWYN